MALSPQDVQAAQAVQEAAAHAGQAQVRLVAGPGTGKSSTIEERVCWLLREGVDPANIAVVSFTNASVIDLRGRLHAYCNAHAHGDIRDVSITTLHSLALRLLRQAGLLEMYPTRPLVLDDWELENIYDAEFGVAQGIGSKRRREQIRRYYEALWSTGQENAPTYQPPQPPISDQERQRFTAFHQPTAQVYSAVLPGEIVQKCVQAATTGLIDIAQLLGISHLIVDEYQDLNPVDLEFVDHVAAAGATIFVAGDDDQSIYSFRHASPLGIQRFEARYPQAALPVLQNCFRCTPRVLAAATTLILNNPAPNRIPKALQSLYQTANPPNEGIVHRWRFVTAAQESDAIAASCTHLIAAGVRPRDILILLASRSPQAGLWSVVRASLEQAGVLFDPPKEEGFADAPAGRLVLALTRIIGSRDENGIPTDLVAHRTLLGLKRGVGVGTCNSIRAAVVATPQTSFRGLYYDQLPDGVLSARSVNALNHARQTCATIATWAPTDTLGQRRHALCAIVESTIDADAAAAWNACAAPLADGMLLSELRDYIWVDNAQQRNEVLRAVATRLGVDPEDVPPELDRVRVMTMHGAKGLSARVVFIPGLEHGLLPNQHQTPYPAQLLEAARLLYVSITRTRAACILSFAHRRTVQGEFQNRAASQFATHTGGAFEGRNDGLTHDETAAIRATIDDL